MIPMLRVFSSGTLRGMSSLLLRRSSGRKKARQPGPEAVSACARMAVYVVSVSIGVR
jgi:hypothetical protein